MAKRLFFLIISFCLMHGLCYSQDFKAGAAKRSISPKELIPISGGMGAPEMPLGKKGELSVRALVLEKNKKRIAIVCVDNLGWPAYLGNKSRALIKGIIPENIIIGATHTHSAPDAYGFTDEDGNTGADLKYLDWCVVQVADAVNEAILKLEPVVLKTAVGEAKGKIAYNYYADKLYDPRCGVIQAIASSGENKGKTVATLVNYAIHPEVLGTSGKMISPDLCGPLYNRIESNVGGIALFMNGAQGGMVTADTRHKNGGEANTWEECIRIGELLADEALRIIGKVHIQENPVINCVSKIITFPVETDAMLYAFKHSPFLDSAIKNETDNTVSTLFCLINIGEARILTIPGEALPNIGYYLKRKMNSSQPFIFGLTNDAFGYILTKEDFQSFKRYDYISRTSLGENTGDIYVAEALKLLGNK